MIDFFKQASGLFLTEHLTQEEFDNILSKGDILPVCSDYESWDPDYLEQRISEVDDELRQAYHKGILQDSSVVLNYFGDLCKILRKLCTAPNDIKMRDSAFNKIKDNNGNELVVVYFSENFDDWSVKSNEIEYNSWTDNFNINYGFKKEDVDKAIYLLDQAISQMKSKSTSAKRRRLDVEQVLKKM
jgi:hypothetical protein